ncbi:MAG TPA: hypothetical protein VFW44_09630 [Bryobacteraceae bacterium]|nr:hypothetical protein [Bryobacteraceae bacterium]
MRRAIAALFLFGISFGYVEAAVVVYLRAIYDPIRARLHPGRAPNDLFPLITPQQLAASGPENTRRLAIEIGREACTIVMLGAVALAVARNLQQWFAAFVIVFGVWDISFYAFLKLLIHWPESLSTWDILFLIPLPWVGPVWAPVLVALTMIVCGIISLRAGGIGGGVAHWTGILAGALVMVIAFVWDFRNTMSGGLPNPFNWPLFLLGEAIALSAFLAALRLPVSRESRKLRDS